ncbi:phage minor head protein [Streptomyces griseorubiginosus]|uniref:phage minor head protein n=1 Tax=Streptomyces griseorubiginosus TaxID=67304 RepID=UPI0033DD78B1
MTDPKGVAVARWNLLRRIFGTSEQTATPDTTKALAPAAPQTFTPAQVGTLVAATAQAARTDGTFQPLPRTEPQVPFGPGIALTPAAIDPLRPDGRTEPRFNEYPVTSNLPGVGDRLVPWKVLRDAADAGGLPRRCIEIRKAEVTTLDWAITITKEAVEAAQATSDKPRAEVEQDLRQKLSAEMVRCTRFWQKPDPGQDENFAEWVGKVLEEHFVLDAIAIYPRRTYGGDLYALEVLDGSTIKPLRDHRGGRPLPPNPAYQQILWGFPRGEFIADVDDGGQVINGYEADQLVYKRRNVRAHTPYGYSAVEQALEDVDVWLRRRKWIRDEYTEGTVPVAFLTNTGQSSWTPSQLREYETDLNDVYTGSTAARHRMRVLPPGFAPTLPDDFGEKYKPEYDLFLIKQISSHFDVTIAELGFTETGGLGSTGWHEGQAAVQQRKATLPTLRWLQQLLTAISRSHLQMPPELEFRFLGLEEEDEAGADEVARNRVMWGRMTINEDRDRMGQPRFDFPEADMPMVMTSRGVILLAGAAERGEPGTNISAEHHGSSPDDTNPGAETDDGEDPEGEEDTANDSDGDGERADAVKAELAAYRRWNRRNPTPTRPFAFQTVTKADAPDLTYAPVVFATPGGDDHPKDDPVSWPGWHRDQETATLRATRLGKALRQTVNCEQLAERWLAQELVKADEPDPTTAQTPPQQADTASTGQWTAALAAAFLTAQGITLTAPIAATLAGIWTEGWAIGAAAARAVLDGQERARFTWTIGDQNGARQALTTAMADALHTFLTQHQGSIIAIADRRLQVFARVLADATARGLTAKQLAQALREALADDAWLRMVALTELTRASTQAARAAYTTAGVTAWRWATEPDACPVCTTNQDAGPRAIGEIWPDGSAAPPAHPHCRCYPLPEYGQW